ncbi:hypothetical protein C8F04DRAFT_1186618 [Mycena alexandri]|uniref:Uncharacterized protein n=1 Tax=Mycena alexandri TaxID=1745969 RepID=A0AAD6X392_9AGAR|nr:hypothetical protein C8F04DRAFT_1186618 [Mycena alexandri]
MPVEACSSVVFYSRELVENVSIDDFLSLRGNLRLVNKHMNNVVRLQSQFWTRLILSPHTSLDPLHDILELSEGNSLYVMLRATSSFSDNAGTKLYESDVWEFLSLATYYLSSHFSRCRVICLQASSDHLINIMLRFLQTINTSELLVFETEVPISSFDQLTPRSLSDFRFTSSTAPCPRAITCLAVRHGNTSDATCMRQLMTSAPPTSTVWLPASPLSWSRFESMLESTPVLSVLILDSINLSAIPSGVLMSAPFPDVSTLDLQFSGMTSMGLGARHLNLPGLKELIFRCDVPADLSCILTCSVFLVNVWTFRVTTLDFVNASDAPFAGLVTGTKSYQISNINRSYCCPNLQHLLLRDVDLTSLKQLIVDRRSAGYIELLSLNISNPSDWMSNEERRGWFYVQPFEVTMYVRD